MKLPSTFKSKVTKENLRRVRNSFYDYFQVNKSRVNSIKHQISNTNLIKDFLKRKHVVLSESEIKEKYQEIINKNASLLDIYPFGDGSPLISIIVVNRNGISHLKGLFKNFREYLQYPSYEVIVVDNASTDDSIDLLEDLKADLPLKIIKNTENVSFSKANNAAVNIARGEYVLLLNNDVEPTYGWLNEMMQIALKYEDVGAVGAKLIYPYTSKSVYNPENSFKIQHRGISFKEENGFIKPYNMGNGEDPFESDSSSEELRAAVTAAALLVRKDRYLEVDGLDEGYVYGYEDVDFCLKLLKKGYKNLYCPKSLLFHYEFGTQEENQRREIRGRRLKNTGIFRQKWHKYLRKQFFLDKIYSNGIFSEKTIKVAFVVSEEGETASAGDYFTAYEFGEALKELGWEVSFLSRRGSGNWYEIEDDVDVVISMLDAYDPNKIRCSNQSLITVAWPRNWFDRWVSHSGFSAYDVIFAPSTIACEYIKEESGREAFLLPLATNTIKFNDRVSKKAEYISDYCFTGSYWDDPREIIEFLNPDMIPYDFKLYGKNWDKIEKFKSHYQGFINYSNLPEVYASTKIVIDDANRVTKGYGSVNSRVYDAIACGALVLTNGVRGAEETFEGKLPVFSSENELKNLIEYYLSNEDVRIAKIQELQDFVLKNHSYGERANTLREVLEDYILKKRIVIKIPAPRWKEVQAWGDYHIALGLKKEFEKAGCLVMLQILPEWDGGDADQDVAIVLRGLSRYNPKPYHFNIMWNISHPDEVEINEYNQYDHVFIASEIWAREIGEKADVPVDCMLQCTDPELFYPESDEKYRHELLFVGNSRKVNRKILKDLLPTDKDLAVYGKNWRWRIPRKHVKGEHIPNNELRKAYSSCNVLLNDHWDDMREKGFISNRIFDGFASGAFIVSDHVKGAEDIFGESLVIYDSPEELKLLLEKYLNNESKRKEKSEAGRKITLEQFTYKNKAEQILKIIN